MDEEKKSPSLIDMFTALISKKKQNQQDCSLDQGVIATEEAAPLNALLSQDKTETGNEKCEESKPIVIQLEDNSPLWNLWQYWYEHQSEENVKAIHLYLDEVPNGKLMPLTPSELKEETLRIQPKLEKQAQTRLKKVNQQKPEEEPVVLAAECWIHIAKNGMLAWAFAVPPVNGGEGLTIQDMQEALKKEGVTIGIDLESCSALLQNSPYFRLLPVAWGMLPVQGENGQVIERYPRVHKKTIQLDEDGNVDYRAQCYVQLISKEDIICDIIPPKEGQAGLRVTGKEVKPAPVKPAHVPRGSNTEVSEDGQHLVATMDGHLQFNTSAFQVKPMLDIPGDVDYSTGNVDFHGDVHIAGDVREKFSVRATGTVSIDGLVEAASIEADGDIIVTKGVLGDNKAILKSRKSVRAKYLENCIVYSGEATFADCIIASQIYSDDSISVLTGRGTVIGGTLAAAHRVEATVIGSKSGRKTEIILGILPYVQEECRDNQNELDGIEQELNQIEQNTEYLESQMQKGQETSRLSKLRLRKSVLALKKDKLSKRQKELKELTVDISRCRIECGIVYPTTIITIGSGSRRIDEIWHKCTAVYDPEENEIQLF